MLLLLLSRFSRVRLCATPAMAAHQAPPSLGCHFLLQCMKVKSESAVAQLCPTLSDPMDCSPAGSSVHGISRQEYWSGMPYEERANPIPTPTPTALGASKRTGYLFSLLPAAGPEAPIKSYLNSLSGL